MGPIGHLLMLLLAGLPALGSCRGFASVAHANVDRQTDVADTSAQAWAWHPTGTSGENRRGIAGCLLAVAGPSESLAETAAAGPPTTWRRTRQGWERSSEWNTDRLVSDGPPALHPIVVGLFELMLAVALLIALSDRENGHSRAECPAVSVGDQRRP